jgi:hypothetical protein
MTEAKDANEKTIKPDLAGVSHTPDVNHARNADASTLAQVESHRTNKSNGSLVPERRTVDSFNISLSDGNGGYTALVNRESKLTEKDLPTKSISLLELVRLQEQGDKTANGLVDQYEHAMQLHGPDKNVEMARLQLLSDRTYNRGEFAHSPRPLTQAFSDFVNAASVRLMDPHTREIYFQGQIEKIIGIGEGLNIAKEETKKDALNLLNYLRVAPSAAAEVAIKALGNGDIAKFMSQPNAINDPLFKTANSALDAIARSPETMSNVLPVLGGEIMLVTAKSIASRRGTFLEF